MPRARTPRLSWLLLSALLTLEPLGIFASPPFTGHP
jgi:hypothetical protein